MKIPSLNKLPNFSDTNYTYASYICGALVSASSIFFIYEMFTSTDFSIDIEWNIFKSAWFSPLFVIGFILAIVNWGKFGHWGGQPINVYEDRYGNKYKERSNDIGDNLFGHVILPLLGHFVIEPIIYACIIFYPLMCIFAILGFILPYALTMILIAISVLIFLSKNFAKTAVYRSVVLIILTVLMGGGLTWAAWSMEAGKHPASIVLPTESSTSEKNETENNDNMFDTTDADDTPTSNINSKATDSDSDDMFDDANTTQTSTSNSDDADMFN